MGSMTLLSFTDPDEPDIVYTESVLRPQPEQRRSWRKSSTPSTPVPTTTRAVTPSAIWSPATTCSDRRGVRRGQRGDGPVVSRAVRSVWRRGRRSAG
ncbi:hypothetical protein [Actinosynnema sp. ALI-1.44]|uniref:hypothetical protein n=1 Tax=Actinosynnema sp. ALI-1.44 TaxID=1933779 RepID=UPI003F8D27E8